VSVLLYPYLPEATLKLLGTLGAPETSFTSVDFGAGSIRQVQKLEPLFPKKDA